MYYLYQVIFYKPVLNTLVFFYNAIPFHDFGLAIILTTLLLRLILAPLFHKGAHQQAMMQRIQPKIKKLQELHKDNKEKQTETLMALYKEHGVNPFSGIVLLIVQLPILIGLYSIIRSGIGSDQIALLYPFIFHPAVVTHSFFGIIDLQAKNFVLVLLAAIAQYFQAKLALYDNPNGSELSQTEKMARQMAFIGPIITVFIFYSLPAAVGLYWLTSSVFSILQQLIVNHKLKNVVV